MGRFDDLRLLNNFVVVYKQESITGASRLLNISQPALTRSIQSLENEMGTLLFERTPTGLKPTAFAEKLYRRALKIINEVDGIHGDLLDLALQFRHLLNVGSGLGCWCSVADAVIEFQAKVSDVSVNVRVSNARDLVSIFEKGGLDMVVGKKRTVESYEFGRIVPYKVNDLYYIVRRGHPVLELPVDQQIAALSGYPYATYHLLQDSPGMNLPPSPSIRVNHHLFLFRALSKSDNYFILSHEMLDYAAMHGLCVVGGVSFAKDELAVGYNPEGLSAVANDFLGYLLARAKK